MPWIKPPTPTQHTNIHTPYYVKEIPRFSQTGHEKSVYSGIGKVVIRL